MENEKRLIYADTALTLISAEMAKYDCDYSDYIDGVYRGLEIAYAMVENTPTAVQR